MKTITRILLAVALGSLFSGMLSAAVRTDSFNNQQSSEYTFRTGDTIAQLDVTR